MSDEGRDPQARKFEPPPWEREQFEELARRREEEERARAALEEPAGPAAEPAAPAPGTGTPERQDQPGNGQAPAPEAAREGAGEDAPAVSDRQIEAMLVQLSGEEPTDKRGIARVGKVVSAAVAVIGLVIVVFAVIQGMRSAASGPVAATSTAVGVLIGGGIVGAAVWLWIRSSRLQGS